MLGKINSTSFKGSIYLSAEANSEVNNKGCLQNVKINTDDIFQITQKEKEGYTEIWTRQEKNDPKRGPLFFNLKLYCVPANVTSTADILSAYVAASTNKNLVINLENKSGVI